MMNDVEQVCPVEHDGQLPSSPSGVQPGKSGGFRGAPDPLRRSQTGRMKVRWEEIRPKRCTDVSQYKLTTRYLNLFFIFFYISLKT